MGLDTVEIVIRTEETFGVQIDDEAAGQMTTPRLLANYIWRQVAHRPAPDFCFTQHAFHLLRRSFIQALDVPRKSVGLETKLADLLPHAARRQSWQQLKQNSGAIFWPNYSWLVIRNFFCHDLVTVRDLTRYFVDNNQALWRTWTRPAVTAAIRTIISEETGQHSFKDDDRFIEDMKIG